LRSHLENLASFHTIVLCGHLTKSELFLPPPRSPQSGARGPRHPAAPAAPYGLPYLNVPYESRETVRWPPRAHALLPCILHISPCRASDAMHGRHGHDPTHHTHRIMLLGLYHSQPRRRWLLVASGSANAAASVAALCLASSWTAIVNLSAMLLLLQTSCP
jgi:hypothetical protein